MQTWLVDAQEGLHNWDYSRFQKLLWEGCMTVKALNGRSLLASVWDPKTLLASLEPPSQVPWRLLRKVARWRCDRRSRVMARLLWLRAAAHPCSAVLL